MKTYKQHNKKTTKYSKKKSKKKQNQLTSTISLVIVGLLIAAAVYYLSQKFNIDYTLMVSIEIAVLIIFSILFVIKKVTTFIKIKTYKSTMSKIDRMSGQDFELVLKKYFEKKGYRVETTPTSNDYGADLVLHKGGIKTVVQAKRYKNSVGNSAVQEIVAAKAYYKAKKCLVITNSYFTKNAKNLAQVNGVELWDRNKLRMEFDIKD